MKMKAVKAYRLSQITGYYMPVGTVHIGIKAVFMQMRIHSGLRASYIINLRQMNFFIIDYNFRPGNHENIDMICYIKVLYWGNVLY